MFDVSRKEFKYAVSPIEAARIRQRLRLVTKPDPHNGDQGYLVRSLYFDTTGDRDYLEKISGCDVRQKVRLRIYGVEDQLVKLELKEKKADFQRKRSLPLTRDEAEQLIRGDYGCLLRHDNGFAHEMYARMTTNLYRSKCIVQYLREAYCLQENETRITFDSQGRFSESSMDLFDPHLMLLPMCELSGITLEVKYNNFLLSAVKNALGGGLGVQESRSKYCAGRRISHH